MVTLLPCMAMWLTIANMFTRKSSLASCRANKAVDWNRYVPCLYNIHTTSHTKRWKGSFFINNSLLFWYRRISLNATVPGLNLRGLRTRPFAR